MMYCRGSLLHRSFGFHQWCRQRGLIRLLLLPALTIAFCALDAMAQQAWPGGEALPEMLPPTTLVTRLPAESQTPPAHEKQDTSPQSTYQKPSIIWHLVDGRWRWHCVAHCSRYKLLTNPRE